jgi:putative SOS response-associated peptidase YedK
MCGRYLIETDDDYDEIMSVVDEVSGKFRDSDVAKGEIFPANNVPVVYSHNGRKVLSAAKWGFPGFRNKGIIINARAETIAEKPMFKNPLVSRRCLVPANGYFEWLKNTDREKTKYLIRVREKHLFYMAGLYNMFTNQSGLVYAAITIITTAANPDTAFIHDRMPAILQDESTNAWLDKSNTNPLLLQSLLVPYKSGEIRFDTA